MPEQNSDDRKFLESYDLSTRIRWEDLDLAGSSLAELALALSDDITEGSVNLFHTDTRARSAVGGILVDSQTVDFTFDAGTPSITADVISQLSITDDSNGIKLVNDVASPGNSFYYGTNNSGTKGFHVLEVAGFDADEMLASGYWSILTDGDEDAPELIFASGDVVAAWIPV